jgi:hypothetical protein
VAYSGSTCYVFPCNDECTWEDDFYDIVWDDDNYADLVLMV